MAAGAARVNNRAEARRKNARECAASDCTAFRRYRPARSLWQTWQCCVTFIVAALGTVSELALWHSEQQFRLPRSALASSRSPRTL